MRPFKIAVAFYVLFANLIQAQETTVNLTASVIGPDNQIRLAEHPDWWYRPGNNPDWAKGEMDTLQWKKKNPLQVSKKAIAINKREEGWFRLKVGLDSTLKPIPVFLRIGVFGPALDVFQNGEMVLSAGQMTPYQRSEWQQLNLISTVRLTPDTPNVIAIHYLYEPLGFPASSRSIHFPFNESYNDYLGDYSQ